MLDRFSRRLALASVLAVGGGTSFSWPLSAGAATDPRNAIMTVMNASAEAWSAGDLSRFMETYEDSPDTVYIGRNGTVNGRAAIQAMYAANFSKATPGSLGKLTFDVIDIRPLGDRHALMIGRYHLASADAGKPEASGIFSLVFHERAGQWRIVCDHTS